MIKIIKNLWDLILIQVREREDLLLFFDEFFEERRFLLFGVNFTV
jgi:hypothetical protein